jgi:hypothetical protein
MVKVEVIKKIRNQSCGACHKTVTLPAGKRVGCCRCGGTGKIKDYHYIMIVGKNAFDVDTLK